MQIKDKRIVITGGSSGLGKELARILLAEGARVIISAHNETELLAAGKELGCDLSVADVTDERAVAGLVAHAKEHLGGLDIFVNNAGVWMPHCLAEEGDIVAARRMMEVNFWGTAYGSREALRIMKTAKSGMILNIISVSALGPRPTSSFYSSSKFAVDGFTKAIREEAAPLGVPVLSVYPSYMKTELFHETKMEGYDNFLEPADVARKIVENIKQDMPVAELVIER